MKLSKLRFIVLSATGFPKEFAINFVVILISLLDPLKVNNVPSSIVCDASTTILPAEELALTEVTLFDAELSTPLPK